MKKLSLIAIPLIAVMMFVGCSHNAEVSKNADESLNVSLSASNTENSNSKIVTENESSTQISTTETTTTTKPKETEKSTTATTTAKPDDKKSAGQTTTKKVTTTQKSTTTQKQTTTQKVTTTQKQTTTKKVTTTSAPYWCDEGGTHHSCEVGQIGWVNSYDEASDKAYDYLGSHNVTGNFRVKQCHNCGKFTAKITLD